MSFDGINCRMPLLSICAVWMLIHAVQLIKNGIT